MNNNQKRSVAAVVHNKNGANNGSKNKKIKLQQPQQQPPPQDDDLLEDYLMEVCTQAVSQGRVSAKPLSTTTTTPTTVVHHQSSSNIKSNKVVANVNLPRKVPLPPPPLPNQTSVATLNNRPAKFFKHYQAELQTRRNLSPSSCNSSTTTTSTHRKLPPPPPPPFQSTPQRSSIQKRTKVQQSSPEITQFVSQVSMTIRGNDSTITDCTGAATAPSRRRPSLSKKKKFSDHTTNEQSQERKNKLQQNALRDARFGTQMKIIYKDFIELTYTYKYGPNAMSRKKLQLKQQQQKMKNEKKEEQDDKDDKKTPTTTTKDSNTTSVNIEKLCQSMEKLNTKLRLSSIKLVNTKLNSIFDKTNNNKKSSTTVTK